MHAASTLSLAFSAMTMAFVSAMALLSRKTTTGAATRCLVRRSDAPIRIEPSTKSLALPSNHVISITASAWNSARS